VEERRDSRLRLIAPSPSLMHCSPVARIARPRSAAAARQIHRIHACAHRLGVFAHDRLSHDGRGGGAASEPVAGLRGELAQRLRACILELVGEFELLGDGDAVFGDSGVPNALSSTTLQPFGPKVIGRCEAKSRCRPAEGIEHHCRRSRRQPIPAAAGLTQGWSGRQDLNGGNLGSHEWGNKAHNAPSLALVRLLCHRRPKATISRAIAIMCSCIILT
jgi:hypothetical protein